MLLAAPWHVLQSCHLMRYSRKFRMSFVKYSMFGQDGSTLVLRSMIDSRVVGLDRGLWFVCCMVDFQHGTWT